MNAFDSSRTSQMQGYTPNDALAHLTRVRGPDCPDTEAQRQFIRDRSDR